VTTPDQVRQILADGERLAASRVARVINATKGGRDSFEYLISARRLNDSLEAIYISRLDVSERDFPNLSSAVKRYVREQSKIR
jgi:hypothetical protein